MELAVAKVVSLTTDSNGDSLTLTTTDDVGEGFVLSLYIDPNFDGIDWDKLRQWAGENEFVNIALVRYEDNA